MLDWIALALAVAAVVAAVVALRRVDVVERRARRWAQGGSREGPDRSIVTEAAGPADFAGTGSLRRVAVVRYDAFEDMGGRLSYSAAILDDSGRGVVLTAIHGRSETRTYLKRVPPGDEGRPAELSPEESQAVREAMRESRDE